MFSAIVIFSFFSWLQYLDLSQYASVLEVHGVLLLSQVMALDESVSPFILSLRYTLNKQSTSGYYLYMSMFINLRRSVEIH